MIRSIVAGKADMDLFTTDYKAHVSEEKLKAMASEMRRGGPIESLQVVRRFRKGNNNVHSYLMTQGQVQLIVTLFIDDQGKIAGMTISAP